MYEITKTYRFEAAHRLIGHDGKCARLHGHSYRVDVSLSSGQTVDRIDAADYGMVTDFHYLDELIAPLIKQMDHRFLIPLVEYNERDAAGAGLWVGDDELVPLNIPRTTAERLAYFFFKWLYDNGEWSRQSWVKPFGDQGPGPAYEIRVDAVTVWETETSRATYRA